MSISTPNAISTPSTSPTILADFLYDLFESIPSSDIPKRTLL